MTSLVLDAGAFIGVDQDDRAVLALLQASRQSGLSFRTTANVVAQVWRDERGRQANLARFLRSVDIRPVDDGEARRAGALLGVTGTSDVVDATLVLLTQPGDTVLTSDRRDVAALLAALRRNVALVDC